MKLVQLPGTGVWVNPEYVTSVRPYTIAGRTGVFSDLQRKAKCEVEYEGDAGYRTRRDVSTATVEEMVLLLTERRNDV